MELLKSLDFLSTEAKLTFNKRGEIRHKTIIGAIFSILSVSVTLGLGIYFFYEFISKNNKSLITSSTSSNTLNLTDSHNIPFLFRLTDPKNKPYPQAERLYKIALKFWHSSDQDTNQNTEQTTDDISIETCNINKHFGKYKNLFLNISDLDTFFCAVPRNYNQTIYGLYGDTNPFGYYHFYVYMCLNQSSDDICFDEKEVRKTLSNTYLEIRSVDYSIDNQNTVQVAIPNIRTDRHMLSLTVYKRIWIYLNAVTYISDDGLIFVDKSTETFYQYESFRYDVDLRNISTGTIPGTFTTVTVLSTGTNISYNRKFNKIQEYIATMGGMINCISTIGFLLNYFFSKNSYYLKLIEEFAQEKEIYVQKKKLTKSINNTTTVSINNFVPGVSLPHATTSESTGSKNKKNKKSGKNSPKRQNSEIHWYQMVLPLTMTKQRSRSLQKKIETVNKSLNIFEVMKCVMTNRILDLKSRKSNTNVHTKYTEYFNQTNSSGLVNSFHHHNSTVLDYLNKQGGNLSNKNKPKNNLDNQENRIENPEFSAEMLTQKLEQK